MAVIFLGLSLCSVQDGKSVSYWEPSSRVVLHEKFLAEVSFVSKCCQDIWTVKGMVPPVKNTVANHAEVMRSDKLRCNRVTSCLSIIGPHCLKTLYSDYENHKMVSYFQ